MSKIDREAIVISISRPTDGNPMPGTGGARNDRFSGRTCGVCCNQARLIQARWQMDGEWMEAAADARTFAPVNSSEDLEEESCVWPMESSFLSL